MKRIVYFIVFYCSILTTNAQNLAIGGRTWGLANANTCLTNDVFAAFSNQAGLAAINQVAFGVYGTNYHLTDVSTQAFALAIPTKTGVLGFNFRNFGRTYFYEQKVGLSYSRTFGKVIDFGLQLDYIRNQIDFITTNRITFELGTIIHISPKTNIGFHLYDPIQSRFAANESSVVGNTVAKLGIGYQISTKVLIAADFLKQIDYPNLLNVGLEYQPTKSFAIRGGTQINRQFTISTFGFGYTAKRLTIDLATSIHSVLGITPHLSMGYRLAPKD